MEQQKGSFKYGNQDQKEGNEQKVSGHPDSLQKQEGIVTHANPKSRDDNRNSKGPAADRGVALPG